MKKLQLLLVFLASATLWGQSGVSPYIADNGDGTYINPILMAD